MLYLVRGVGLTDGGLLLYNQLRFLVLVYYVAIRQRYKRFPLSETGLSDSGPVNVRLIVVLNESLLQSEDPVVVPQ